MSNPNGHLIHGLCSHPLYGVWQTMRQRCSNPKCRGYKWYGAKGIKVCEEWQSIENFYKWSIQNGYTIGLTIDRIDPAGDYEPNNCRWITISEQQSNRRTTHFIEYQGERHTLTEWSKLLHIPRGTLSNRLNMLGWSVEKALGGGKV